MLINKVCKNLIISLIFLNLLTVGSSVLANPQGGVVVDGSASITRPTSTTTNIKQNTDKVILDWNSFNIGSKELVSFNQPSSSSVALNRIRDINPSNIAGRITANGRIFLVNPNGILFTSTSKIDVGSMFATTSDITNENFKNGKYIFDISGKDSSFIKNQGVIKSTKDGYVILAAPSVINSGTIDATGGVAGIYSGNKFILDYSDNVKVNITSSNPSVDSEIPLVSNTGLIQGQKVYLTADTENLLIKNAVNTTGIVKATGSTLKNGQIVFGEVNIDGQSGKTSVGGTVSSSGSINIKGGNLSLTGQLQAKSTNGGNINILADYIYYSGSVDVSGANGGKFTLNGNNLDFYGKVNATGTKGTGGNVDIDITEGIMANSANIINVSGYTNGGTINQTASGLFSSGSYLANGTYGKGGTIKLGGNVSLLSADLEAKGKTGCGVINIGGNWQGGANLPVTDRLRQSSATYISQGTNINASVTGTAGNGGEVTVWSTGDTQFYGNIKVTPGTSSGIGGNVEVSGNELTMTEGKITTGKGGNILLDPHDLIISNDPPQAVDSVKFALGYFSKRGTSFTINDDDYFGTSIALNGVGNLLAVGATGDDAGGYENGAVYIFTLNPSDLTQAPYFRYKIVSPVTSTTNYKYGQSIAFNGAGNILAVGAIGDDTGGTDRGAVYLYDFNNITYVPTYKYKLASGSVFTTAGFPLVNSDNFGSSVALNGTGNILAVGANLDDATLTNTGAVYLFSLNTSNLTQDPVLKTKIKNGTYGLTFAAGDQFGKSVAFNHTGDIMAIGAHLDDTGVVTGVTDGGAVYLFTLDTSSFTPTLQKKIRNGTYSLAIAASDNFGTSVALNGTGDILAVGAPLNDTGAASGNRGAVYLFHLDATDLTQDYSTIYKIADGPNNVVFNNGDYFGSSVALNNAGNVLAVGAYNDDTGWTNRGASYLFDLTSVGQIPYPIFNYKLDSRVKSLELADFDNFGYSIALNNAGNILAAGTIEDDAGGINRGAVYLFSMNPSDLSVSPEFKYKIGTGTPGLSLLDNDCFGSSVALNAAGNILAIGAMKNDTGGTDRGAVYLFNIDPTDLTKNPIMRRKVAYGLTGLSIASGDYFGYSVALNDVGDIMAVGAPYNDTGATNGNRGAVFIFSLNLSDLSQAPVYKYKLAHGLGITLANYDNFGESVALNGVGDILAAGAVQASNDNNNHYGEVYLFTLNPSSLTSAPVFKNKLLSLLDVDSTVTSSFGCSIAMNSTGNILAVGDYVDDNFDESFAKGLVYLFNLNTSDLTQAPVLQHKLVDTTSGLSLKAHDDFGRAVALNGTGNILVVTAPRDDTGGVDRGAIYTFNLNPSDLTQAPTYGYKLAGGTKGLSLYNSDYFGISAALNGLGDKLAIGAYGDNTGGADRGAVYLFTLNTSDLSQAPVLKYKLSSGYSVTLDNSDYFGYSVALNSNGDLLAVGAIGDDDAGTNAGAVYLFHLNEDLADGAFQELKIASGTGYTLKAGDQFGVSVAMNNVGDILAVGANSDDTGVTNAGAVYLFNIDNSNFTYTSNYKSKIASGTVAGFTMTSADNFGRSVSLNGTGNILAIGAPNNDTDGSDRGVVYLFDTTDPVNPVYKKKISNSTFADAYFYLSNSDNFGTSVALNDTGDYLMVGIPGYDFVGSSIGQAFVLLLNTSDLTQNPTIKGGMSAEDYTTNNQYFGSSVALNGAGDIMVIGGYGTNTGGYQRGAAYIYKNSYTSYFSAKRKYDIQNAMSGFQLSNHDYFGYSIALNGSGSILAIGSPYDDTGARATGAVYLFNINPSDITQAPVLRYKLADGSPGLSLGEGDWFGEGLALNGAGDILAVGADWEVNVNNWAGEVYLFSLNPDDLTQAPVLKNKLANLLGIDLPTTYSEFGRSIALNNTGDILVASDYIDSTMGDNKGVVYIFSLNPADLAETPVLKYKLADTTGVNLTNNDFFGSSLALNIAGDILAVGAKGDDTGGTDRGAVYLFNLDTLNLSQSPVFKHKIASGMSGLTLADNDSFGISAALSGTGDTLAVGSDYDNSNGNNLGEIFIFSLNPNNLEQAPVLSSQLVKSMGLNGSIDFEFACAIALNDSGNLLATSDYTSWTVGYVAGLAYLFNLGSTFNESPTVNRQISANIISSSLSSGSNVILQANNDIFLNSAINVNNASGNGGVLTLQAGRSILIGANIMTDNADLNIIANETNGVIDAARDSGNAVITMVPGTSINAGAGNVTFDLKNGTGKTHSESGSITLETITAKDITILNEGLTDGSDLIINNNAVLTASGTGNSIILSAANGNFINNFSSSALSTSGRWLIYSKDNVNIQKSGLTGNPVYPATYLTNAPDTITGSDNKFIYAAGNFHIITSDSLTKVYGSANPDLIYSISSTVPGDTITGSASLSTIATESSNVGNYAITSTNGTLASSLGYDFIFVDGTLSITQKSLTVSAVNKTKVYGSANPALTANYSGFVLDQDSSVLGGNLVLSTSADDNSDVGNYAITSSGLTSSNYTISYVDGNLSVTPKDLTVTANNKTKIYGSANLAFTASYSGFVLDQDNSVLGGNLSFSTIATQSSNVGNYAITSSGLTSSNYSISYVDGNLSVTPKALTVTADNKTKVYGSANPAFTTSYSGFVLDQDSSVLGGNLAFSTTATQSSNVGNYAITPSGLTSSNYSISYVDGNLSVTPKALTVTADNKTKVYGSANPAFTTSYSGFVLDQDSSVLGGNLAFSTTATESSDVGNYAITPSGLTSSNYTISYVDGNLSITPKTLTVIADNKSKVSGDPNPTFTARYSGFVLGQDNSVLGGRLNFSTVSDQQINVGNYPIVPYGLNAENYIINYINGILTIDTNTKANNITNIARLNSPDLTTDTGLPLLSYYTAAVNRNSSFVPLDNIRIIDKDNILNRLIIDNFQPVNIIQDSIFSPKFTDNKVKLNN